jgi:hypothetical protein
MDLFAISWSNGPHQNGVGAKIAQRSFRQQAGNSMFILNSCLISMLKQTSIDQNKEATRIIQ